MRCLRNILTVALVLLGTIVLAQRPKMDLRVYAGYHSHIFVYKDLDRSKDLLHGAQGGFGVRVKYRKVFGEVDFNFVRTKFTITPPDSITTDFATVRINAFELPIKAGLILVRNAWFKWYAYTGAGLRFNTKGKLELGDDLIEFKPKELGLSNPNVDFLLGSQVDIGWLNLELMYSLGVNNAITENIRTNSHELQFNVGIWF